MRKSVFPILLLASLAGCAATSQPGSYGSFVADSMPAHEKAVVDDAVTRLVAAYPPARTKLQLQHPASDAFGTALLASMRTRGYALGEYQGAAKAPTTGDGHTFAYIFDQPGGTDLYRVTLLIDNQPLSRVYETKDGALAPAGSWVRKE